MSARTDNPGAWPRCCECVYWKQSDVYPKLGDCRRNAPRAMPEGVPTFAMTSDDDWCGQFRGLELPQAVDS